MGFVFSDDGGGERRWCATEAVKRKKMKVVIFGWCFRRGSGHEEEEQWPLFNLFFLSFLFA